MYLLYDIILLAVTPLLLPYAWLKGLSHGDAWSRLGERLALYRSQRLEFLKDRKVIWVHAVSVGETRATIPLLKEMRRTFPEAAIVLSSLTFTGREMADKIEEADLCVFLPYDISWIVTRAFKVINPDIILLVETEIWPNFVRKAKASRRPVVLVNGRISDRSFPRYWLVKPLLEPILKAFTHFFMQSRQDQLRITRLGADSAKVTVTGNLKFDLPAPDFSESDIDRFRTELRLPPDIPIWVSGSTRQGEEEVILQAYRQLLDKGHELVLVLVPRYPDRARSVSDLVEKFGLRSYLRTSVNEITNALASGDVLVGDTLGEMMKFYACADIVFVGGSLVPIGGHNILEASLLGKPVLFGPHMQNFRTISRLLLDAEGGFQVDSDNLVEKLEMLLLSSPLRQKTGEKGRDFLSDHTGATLRTVNAVLHIMDDQS